MPDPRELLICLLDYIKEQTKEVNPEAFRLSTSKGFQRQRNDLAGLPGVEFDIKVAGDHIWLRVPRLAAQQPPLPPPSYKGIIRFNTDPSGPPAAYTSGRLVSMCRLTCNAPFAPVVMPAAMPNSLLGRTPTATRTTYAVAAKPDVPKTVSCSLELAIELISTRLKSSTPCFCISASTCSPRDGSTVARIRSVRLAIVTWIPR
jgi:hypothetical protein